MGGTGCLDDDTIAALADGDTSARDALVHLEDCSTCRELVSLARIHHADTEPAPARLAAGMLIGRHRITRPLGTGGMGVVYLARDPDLDRDVAVKLLRGPRDTDALGRESRALAKLDHPNVVTAYEVGRHGDETYLVMEHVDGGTLRDWLAAQPRSFNELVAVFADAARGLAAAHAAGLVHRDVKPDNILVGNDGRARVSDFGLAGAGDTLAGTPRYMAPEVLRGEPATARSDQWSLCASLWECAFGAPLRTGESRDEWLAAKVPEVPPAPAWLRRALERGLATEPAARFNSLDELAVALAPPRKKKWLVVAAINIAVLGATVGIVAASRDTRPACSGELPDVWDPARRATVAAHLAPLVKDPSAILAALDAYGTRWGQQQIEVCRAERAGDTPSLTELRAACLASRRQSLSVLVDALATVDADGAARAKRAVTTLPALDDCAAAEHLAANQPPPRDPATRAQLAKLELRYDTARTAAVLGRVRPAIPELLDVANAAEQVRYYPLVAAALRTTGREQMLLREAAAVATLRRALFAAQAGSDESEIADISIDLYLAATLAARPETERDDLQAAARAALARLTWRADATLAGMQSYLAWAVGQDALARGTLDVAEREMRAAVAAGITAYGARDRRMPQLRNGLATVLAKRGKPDEAAVQWSLSLQQTDDVIGGTSIEGIPGVGGLPLSLVDAAWQLFDVGRDAEALAFVQRVRRESAGEPPSMFRDVTLDDLEAEIALARGDLVKAKQLVDRAATHLGPNPIRAHVVDLYALQGNILAAGGDCKAAAKWYGYVLEGGAVHGTLTQVARLGVARCLVTTNDLADAVAIFDAELAAGIDVARERPRTMRIAADVHWRLGHRDRAHELARDALKQLGLLPALVAEHVAIVRWLIARSA